MSKPIPTCNNQNPGQPHQMAAHLMKVAGMTPVGTNSARIERLAEHVYTLTEPVQGDDLVQFGRELAEHEIYLQLCHEEAHWYADGFPTRAQGLLWARQNMRHHAHRVSRSNPELWSA